MKDILTLLDKRPEFTLIAGGMLVAVLCIFGILADERQNTSRANGSHQERVQPSLRQGIRQDSLGEADNFG